MKKDLFIKILKYIGVAFIGAFVGIGVLAGASCCSSKDVNKVETNLTERVKHNKKVTYSVSDLTSGNVFYAVAKNYAINGKGVFYEDTISLDNSRIMNTSVYYEPIDYQFTLINGSNVTLNHMGITTALSGGVFRLSTVVFYRDNVQNLKILYHANNGAFDRSNCAFVFKDMTISNESLGITYLNELFDIYMLDNVSFSFQKQINYNAPYGQDIDTYFVNDSNMVNPGDMVLKTIVSDVPFYSGGFVFDTIQLRYFNAQALSYIDDEGSRRTWTASGFASYSWLEYKNTATNYIVVVNQRLSTAWNVGNSSGYDTRKGSIWVSDLYREIQFFLTPPQNTIISLTSFNNTSFSDGFIDDTLSTNVGLSNAFSLLAQAFSAWLPIFNVTILPGITLGLLIFLPLIVGIIILVIWVVKR